MSIRFIEQNNDKYRISMCNNMSYEQLTTIHLDTLHTFLESSCNITTHNDLMSNLTNPIASINVLLHDHKINIITTNKITCHNPLLQYAKEYNFTSETKNSSDRTLINSNLGVIYNSIYYKTTNDTCESDNNNIGTYATIHQTLKTFCPETFNPLLYNISDSENESVRVIRKKTDGQYEVAIYNNMSDYKLLTTPKYQLKSLLSSCPATIQSLDKYSKLPTHVVFFDSDLHNYGNNSINLLTDSYHICITMQPNIKKSSKETPYTTQELIKDTLNHIYNNINLQAPIEASCKIDKSTY